MAQSARGLTPADLIAIREGLASGKRPRVVFTSSAGQMAGNAGHVVELADPDTSDEWIVVQFGRDQLPFSPADLAIPVRATAARGTAPRGRPANPEAVPVKRTVSAAASKKSASVPTPRKEVTVTEPAPVQTKPVQTKPVPANPVPANPVQTKPVPTKPTATPNGNGAAPDAARPARAPKAPASLVVTLAYADREWTIGVNLGARALAKPHAIKPTEALRMIALIDLPGVHDAVENIIAAERIDAQQRAVRLREELAELESRLAELNRS
jgi:hypothetical protein